MSTKKIVFIPFSDEPDSNKPINETSLAFLLALFKRLLPMLEDCYCGNTFILAPSQPASGTFGDAECLAGLLRCKPPTRDGELNKGNLSFEQATNKIIRAHAGLYIIVFVNSFHCLELARYLYLEKAQNKYDFETIRVEGVEVPILMQKDP